MAAISQQQRDRLSRMWDGFGRAGLLRDAVIDGGEPVRVLWGEPHAEHFGQVDASDPAISVLDHEVTSPGRNSIVVIDAATYRVVRTAPNGLGRTDLALELVS